MRTILVEGLHLHHPEHCRAILAEVERLLAEDGEVRVATFRSQGMEAAPDIRVVRTGEGHTTGDRP